VITRIEALNYRCLRYIRQDLGPFHVLVGPNASGKTTLLEVIAFLGRLVSEGPEAAVLERTQNFQDLIWGRQGDRFELAIEMGIPDQLKGQFGGKAPETIRYEVAIGLIPRVGEIGILSEKALLKRATQALNHQRELFPDPLDLLTRS
jgi:AAA15 family ATPase/GTPase